MNINTPFISVPHCVLTSLVLLVIGYTGAVQAINLLPMQLKRLQASDSAAHDDYGITVALSDDTVVVGVPFDNTDAFNAGSVYIYTHNNGVWSLLQRLVASDSAPGDQFGWALALQGDTLIIGARFDDDQGFNSGSAYVYSRKAGLWAEQQKLTANDGSENDQYGLAISMAGDTTIIGAPFDDDKGFDSGSAYVYSRDGGLWSLQQKLAANEGSPGDQFGWSVALQDDNALIGARFDDDQGFNSGAAYFFGLDAQAWVQKQKLTAADGSINDQFGWVVALHGDTAVVGARFDDNKGINSGSAYVYTRHEHKWWLQQHLTASDGELGNQYSWAIALGSDTLIIGAPFNSIKRPLSGSCYVYQRNGDSWSEKQKLAAGVELLAERYGTSIALEGNTLLIGACLDSPRAPFSSSPWAGATCVPFVHLITIPAITSQPHTED